MTKMLLLFSVIGKVADTDQQMTKSFAESVNTFFFMLSGADTEAKTGLRIVISRKIYKNVRSYPGNKTDIDIWEIGCGAEPRLEKKNI